MNLLTDTGANLRAAASMMVFRRPAPGLLRTGAGALAALFALTLAQELAYDLWSAGVQEAAFDPLSLPIVSFWGLCALASSALVAFVLGERAIGPELAAAAFALTCVRMLFSIGLAVLADGFAAVDSVYAAASWVPVGWAALAWGVFLLRVPGVPAPRPRLAAAFLCAIALWIAPQWVTDPGARLWGGPDLREGEASQETPQSEESLYGQFDLLQDALDGIEPAEPGTPELFWITFGGDGSQDVFINEAEGAGAVLSDVFGDNGHSVVLANSRARPRETPFATVSSLQRTLAAMAERMDPDKDVLALVLTSHGSEDHHLSVSLPPFRFEDLTPERLRGLLDDAGIRYRVIIVSACYAGGFIAPLASPDTLVVAAAATDRTSFGCRDGARWTDFGRAYFSEALARTGSFESAFRIAEQDIAAREAREHLAPSQPQIFVGAGIRAALERLHNRRGEAVLAQAGVPLRR